MARNHGSDDRPRPRGDREGPESRLLTYVVPFAAALLVALGIAGTVLGGWALVQPAVGACDDPVITVSEPAETDERIAGNGAALERLSFDELTEAEQRAFEEAIDDPNREGTVRGSFDNRDAFERGVVVTVDGTDRYATLVSADRCLTVDPLALPLGIVSLIVGLVGFGLVAYLNYPKRFRPLAELLRFRR